MRVPWGYFEGTLGSLWEYPGNLEYLYRNPIVFPKGPPWFPKVIPG